MSWRLLERELVDICRAEGLELGESHHGDKVIKQGDLIILSLTDLAKELMYRGVGIGTPR